MFVILIYIFNSSHLFFILLEHVSVIQIVTGLLAVSVTAIGVTVIVTAKADDTVIEIKTVKREATEIEKNERSAQVDEKDQKTKSK